MKKIRLAVIGTGMAWERLHYPAIKELEDKYEIVCVVQSDPQGCRRICEKNKLKHGQVYDDYNEMLKRQDIDAVDILVPIESNYTVSEAVAKSRQGLYL